MKTSITQIWMVCHLLPFAKVGQLLSNNTAYLKLMLHVLIRMMKNLGVYVLRQGILFTIIIVSLVPVIENGYPTCSCRNFIPSSAFERQCGCLARFGGNVKGTG